MSVINLVQNTAGAMIFFLENRTGSPHTSLTAEDVTLALKKPSYAGFLHKPLTPTVNATAELGTGVNGTITVSVPGVLGNTYTVEALLPAGSSGLTTTITGTAITVSLAVDTGIPIPGANTASLIATSITNATADGFATASGDGSTELVLAEGPNALSGGVDGSFSNLGDGFYQASLDLLDTDELGTLYARVTGPQLAPSIETASVVAVASTTATAPVIVAPGTTVLTGTIVSVDGTPQPNVSILAQVLSIPTLLADVAVVTEHTVASTDSNGQFTLTLLTGAQVDVSIPAVNYRRTLTVPAVSGDLFTSIP